MFERPQYEGNLWAMAQSGRVSCSELSKRIAYWRPIATKRLLPGSWVPSRTSQSCDQEKHFHSRRKNDTGPKSASRKLDGPVPIAPWLRPSRKPTLGTKIGPKRAVGNAQKLLRGDQAILLPDEPSPKSETVNNLVAAESLRL